MDLEGVILSEMQRTDWWLSEVESGWGKGEMGEGGQKVQTLVIK